MYDKSNLLIFAIIFNLSSVKLVIGRLISTSEKYLVDLLPIFKSPAVANRTCLFAIYFPCLKYSPFKLTFCEFNLSSR